MDITSLLMSLVPGILGGNIAGALMKKYSLGLLGNSVAGVAGGGIGGSLIGNLVGGGLVGNIAGGGVGGGVLMVVIGLIKKAMAKA